MMNKTESKARTMDRYEGALLGVAVGDALGAPLEFMTAERIRMEHAGEVEEMIGGGWLSVEPGEVTDDTQMTLAVAEGIVTAEENGTDTLTEIGENFIHWYDTNPKDIGNTCASVISKAKQLELTYETEWHHVAENLYKQTGGATAGNGALMRTVYPALWHTHTMDAETAAVRIGRMTHWHGTSDHTVRAYTEAVHMIANAPELSTEGAIEEMNRIMMTLKGFAEFGNRNNTLKPTGYSLDSLMCAIDAINSTGSFEEALIRAVNFGGDADTIGAITGGLAGAIYGASAIPTRWVDALNNEPNAKTVRMFAEGYKEDPPAAADGFKPNILALRIADLAATAYRNSHKNG